MSPATLETARVNEGSKLSKHGNSIAKDDVNENCHIYVKILCAALSKEGFLKQTASLSLDVACKSGTATLYEKKKATSTNSVAPKRYRELKLVASLLAKVDVFNTTAPMTKDLFLHAAIAIAKLPTTVQELDTREKSIMDQMLGRLGSLQCVSEEMMQEEESSENEDEFQMPGDDETESELDELEHQDVVEDGSVAEDQRLTKLKERMMKMKKYDVHRYSKFKWLEYAKQEMLPKQIANYQKKKQRRLFDTKIFKYAQHYAKKKRDEASEMLEQMMGEMEVEEEDLPQWKEDWVKFNKER